MSVLVTLSLIIIILEVYLLAKKGPPALHFFLTLSSEPLGRSIRVTHADDQDLYVHVHVQLPIHQ